MAARLNVIQVSMVVAVLAIGIYAVSVTVLLPLMNEASEILETIFSHFPFSSKLPSLASLKYYTTALFDILILMLMAFYVLHISLDMVSKYREGGSKVQGGLVMKERALQRFSLNQRVQHIILFTTFTLSAVTGFSLKYFGSWGATLVYLMGGLEARRLIHLGAGFTMGALAIYHGLFYGYIYFVKRRRPIPIMFTKTDFSDLIANMLYFLRVTRVKPRFGRYDYIQKFDYWGVYWGILILGVPGVMLWYFSTFGLAAPDPLYTLALVFHDREALLAASTLFVWHFYYVHLNADVFPMSRVWVTGKISEGEMIRDHQLEYAERLAQVTDES